jgi:hypothetical protein
MFNDLIKESHIVNTPELITESFNELKFKQSQFMREMSDYSVAIALSSSTGFMHESDQPDQKSFIKRFVDFFVKMIAKIKYYLDRKFKLTENRLVQITKYLQSVDTSKIEVETFSNINSFDQSLVILNKAFEELKSYRADEIYDTFSKMSPIEKGIHGAKAYFTGGKSLKAKFAGYVPSLSKYNDKDVQKIKDDILGVKKPMKNIRVSTFYPDFVEAQKSRDGMDAITSEYTKLLNRLGMMTSISGTLGAIGPNAQQIINTIVSTLTNFYNRNINLIVGITVQIIDCIVSTATQMAHNSKNGMKIPVAKNA